MHIRGKMHAFSRLTSMTKKYIEKILTARVYDVAIESPLDEARNLSARYQNRILLKRAAGCQIPTMAL